MAYQAPYIDSAGLHISSYQDILADLISNAQTIYGSDIYLGNDSALYQLLSVIALKISDSNLALSIVYNNRGPLTAIGSGLDGIVKLNGLARVPATYSTCQVVLSGVAGTVITSGEVEDVNGFFWDLPASVTIGSGGTVTVTATCETPGAVSAQPNQINIMSSGLTNGWTGVNNTVAAIPGQNFESDSALRARQSQSTELPSQTLFQATIAGLRQTPGVTRATGVENPTGSDDIYGNPPHSISCVVEGGTQAAVAQTIYNNRGMGCYTNGTTAVIVTDPITGQQMTIRFFLPTYIQVTVQVRVHLITGTSATITAIQAAIVNYLNALEIGELISYGALVGEIMAVNMSLTSPQFTLRGNLSAAPVEIGYSAIIGTVTIDASGSGYVVGDIVQILQTGSSQGAQCQVSGVGGGGAVTAIVLLQNGTDYTTATGLATAALTGVGTGLTISITVGANAGPTDIAVNFNEVSQGIAGNVTILQE